MNEYETTYQQAVAAQEDGLVESMQLFSFNKIDSLIISSTNLQERLFLSCYAPEWNATWAEYDVYLFRRL
jgi:mRNA deadenylase 3'-5' endonuclease subunit Ccr4